MLSAASIQQWTPTEFWFWFIISTVIFLLALWEFFSNRRFIELISTTPLSKIKNASNRQLIAIEGQAQSTPNHELLAAISKKKCCWYKYKIEKQVPKGSGTNSSTTSSKEWQTRVEYNHSSKEWKTLVEYNHSSLFLINDGESICVVNPDKVDFRIKTKQCWRKNKLDESLTPSKIWRAPSFLSRGASYGDFRLTEWCIEPGDSIFALGFIESLSKDAAGPLSFQTQETAEDASQFELFKKTISSVPFLNTLFEIPLDQMQKSLDNLHTQWQSVLKTNAYPIYFLRFKEKTGLLSTFTKKQLLEKAKLYILLSILFGLISIGVLLWVLVGRFILA